MAITNNDFTTILNETLSMAIENSVSKAIEKAVEKAKEQVEQEIKSHADTMALMLLRQYSIHDYKDHIVIKVEKNI